MKVRISFMTTMMPVKGEATGIQVTSVTIPFERFYGSAVRYSDDLMARDLLKGFKHPNGQYIMPGAILGFQAVD